MAKQVNFTVNLKINGKDFLVEAGTDARQFAKELGLAKGKADQLQRSLVSFGQLKPCWHLDNVSDFNPRRFIIEE